MSDGEFVLSRRERDEIIRAVNAIERELKQSDARLDCQVAYVIGTNLHLIKAHVSKLPRVTPN